MDMGGHQDWYVVPTHNDNLMVVVNVKENKLEEMNDFMINIIENRFFF